jgi:Fe-S-cluster containining protein
VRYKKPPIDPLTLQAFSQLEAIYQQTDLLFAHWSCPASSECCRFGITGREPYVTALEWKFVERAIAKNGGPLSERNRALPVTDSPNETDSKRLRVLNSEQRTCPLLNRLGRCSIYASRPFGCRTFFCSGASSDKGYPRSEVASLVRQLADLAARFSPDAEKARPFTRLFL